MFVCQLSTILFDGLFVFLPHPPSPPFQWKEKFQLLQWQPGSSITVWNPTKRILYIYWMDLGCILIALMMVRIYYVCHVWNSYNSTNRASEQECCIWMLNKISKNVRQTSQQRVCVFVQMEVSDGARSWHTERERESAWLKKPATEPYIHPSSQPANITCPLSQQQQQQQSVSRENHNVPNRSVFFNVYVVY